MLRVLKIVHISLKQGIDPPIPRFLTIPKKLQLNLIPILLLQQLSDRHNTLPLDNFPKLCPEINPN